MPYYIFENPNTGKQTEIFFHMNDEKKFCDKNGLEWKRVYISPTASVDTKVDPNNPKDFVKVTAKNGTYGELLDRSAELSDKRADKNGGIDPVKETFFKKYSEDRGGLKHPEQKKREANNKLKKLGVTIN